MPKLNEKIEKEWEARKRCGEIPFEKEEDTKEFQSHFSLDQERACQSFYQPDFEQVAKKGGIEGEERENKYKDYILIVISIAIWWGAIRIWWKVFLMIIE